MKQAVKSQPMLPLVSLFAKRFFGFYGVLF